PRVKGRPKIFDQVTERLRLGIQKGLMPPKFLLEKVTQQTRGIASQKPEESPFAQPLSKIPANFSDADKTRLKTELIAAIRDGINPAYTKFGNFLEEQYAPKG